MPDSRKEPRKRPPRFIADGMLGSLARKLRIFGFDAVYLKGDDSELERIARGDGRVLLTSDRQLFAHATSRRIPAVLVEGRTDAARLASVRGKISLAQGGPSRCAVCNGELERVSRAEASLSVPPLVVARHRLYLRCEGCARVYWKGGHWTRLRRLSRTLTKD